MKKTAEDYRQEAREAYEREERSFQRSDTDGCVSQWCSNLSGQLADAKADLLEAGRKSLFLGLYDKRGKRVRAKLITTKFHGHSSMSWLLRMDEWP
jgi:hypothetical protein